MGVVVKKLFEKPNFEIKIIDNQVKLAYGGSAKAFFDVPKELQQITDKLISLQILIEYLQSLYFVRLYDNGAKEKSIELTEKYEITAINEIEDEKINSFYCNRWSNNLCTTEAFEKFVFENKFKTPEQRRFRRQQITTWIGIAIAFGIGVASIWINICK